MKIIVAGIGPGSREDITPAVMDAVAASNVIVGYKYYFQFVEEYLSPGAVCVDSGMRKERERAKQAFEYALQGLDVCVISSGDAGIYGMAPLIWEMYLHLKEQGEQKIGELELKVIPGMECGIKVYAVRRLLYGESPESVHIVLPQREPVRMKSKSAGGDGEKAWGYAEKFSVDDPDITGGKEIFATLRLNWEGSVQFFGGDGVGTVTLPGLGLEVGGPAINNGPRKMMEMGVAQEKELYSEYCRTNGIAQKYGCTFIPDNFTLARELWGMFKGEDAQRFFGGIVELCHSHCAPLIPDGKLEVVLVEE